MLAKRKVPVKGSVLATASVVMGAVDLQELKRMVELSAVLMINPGM